jgi:hypothetical protein
LAPENKRITEARKVTLIAGAGERASWRFLEFFTVKSAPPCDQSHADFVSGRSIKYGVRRMMFFSVSSIWCRYKVGTGLPGAAMPKKKFRTLEEHFGLHMLVRARLGTAGKRSKFIEDVGSGVSFEPE